MTQKAFPEEVSHYLAAWNVTADGPLATTRSSWILPVRTPSSSAMLKVARIPDEQAGFRLMKWWNGQGAAQVIRASEGAILLEKSEGTRNLSAMAHDGQDEEACRIICRAAAALHSPRPAAPPALHPLNDWFRPLFELAPAWSVLAPAAEIARALLADPREVCPLHGDLHHENVLDFDSRGWLAIDPHGLIGDRTFDYANIFTNPDLGDPTRPLATLPGQFGKRLAIVAAEADLEPMRLIRWIVAWTGLSAAWFMGDGDMAGARIDLDINAIAKAHLH